MNICDDQLLGKLIIYLFASTFLRNQKSIVHFKIVPGDSTAQEILISKKYASRYFL